MTSVDHDLTKPSAGSFTLHADAQIMEGQRDGRIPGGKKGSYEIYPEHHISPGDLPNRRSPNLGQAPGCPGSLPESAQKVEELSRQLNDVASQLNDAKARENQMMQTISDLQGQGGRLAYNLHGNTVQEYGLHGNQGQPGHDGHKLLRESPIYQTQEISQSSDQHVRDSHPRPHKSVVHGYVNLGGNSGPVADDPVEENVKDGHIKHLQRQVTILQANLYKAEEFRNKASEAMKERDNTIDELRHSATMLSNAKQENEQLNRHIEELKSEIVKIQHHLRQTCMELDAERLKSQGHNVNQENIAAQRDEIQHLKLSLSQLNRENNRLREIVAISGGSSDSSLTGKHSNENSGISGKLSGGVNEQNGSSACSNELAYLHQVVDTLKRTVLDQRKFLVTMKDNSNQLHNHVANGRRDQMSAMSKSSSAALSPATFRAHGMDTTLPPHSGQGDSQLARQQKPSSPRTTDRNPMPENGSPFEANSAFDLHRQQPCHTVDKLASHSLLSKDSGISTGRLPSNTSSNTSASISTASLASPTRKAVVRASSSNGTQPPPHPALTRKISHSETFARRPVSEQGLNLNQGGSRSALLATASQHHIRPQTNTSNIHPHTVAHANMDANSKLSPSLPATCRQPIPTPPRRPIVYEAALLPPGPDQTQRRPDSNHNSNFLTQTVSASETTQQQHIYRPPPVLLSDNSYQFINSDLMAGSRVTAVTSASESHVQPTDGPGYLDRYIVPQSPRAREAVPPTNESSPPPLNSDRVCPVCNRDYSHVSMEDFQTHVFECFDEDGPETMKASEPTERSCPMCNKKFRGDLPQHEFEAHVHSHFGEENFEMLHRE